MSGANKKLHERTPGGAKLELAAMGMESEFVLLLDDRPVRPEDLFRSPQSFVRTPLMHRTGTSYHLPTGGAIYFDTGVIEVATPVIEIERGCAARAGRSLWEGIHFVRDELDAWDTREGHNTRLTGFSSHYNVSFDAGDDDAGRTNGRTVEKLALLLTYILPPAVMLLATNRRSTGVGVRPRGERIEVTADFTPSAPLMIATATLIVGIIREVMTWPDFELEQLAKHDIPVIDNFKPVPHTSRHGWLARYSCYPNNPFIADVDEVMWQTTAGEMLSLRDIAGRTTRKFWRSIRRVSDPFTFRLIGSVMRGRSPSLLELQDRPEEYEDVGRLCMWDDLFPAKDLSRSKYERVLIRAIAGQHLRLGEEWYIPVRMRGWSEVIFRRERDATRHAFSIDYLLRHARDWRPGEGRRPKRRRWSKGEKV
jgi:hypothetical protein